VTNAPTALCRRLVAAGKRAIRRGVESVTLAGTIVMMPAAVVEVIACRRRSTGCDNAAGHDRFRTGGRFPFAPLGSRSGVLEAAFGRYICPDCIEPRTGRSASPITL